MSKIPQKLSAGEKVSASFGNDERQLTYIQAKTGGANGAGQLGGVYDYIDEVDRKPRRMLVKNDPKVFKDMAEYLTAKIFEQTAPESGAQIALVKLGGKPYIGSKFFRDYDPGEITAKIESPLMPKVHGRVAPVGTLNKITGFFRRHMLGKDGKPKYADFEKTMVTSLLVGDFDVHTSNVGILQSKDEQGRQKLVRIDYGGAFRKLEPEIHPNSRSRHMGKFGKGGPTNHFREYPRSMRTSPEFAVHAFEVANMDLNGKIDEAFNGLKGHYGIEAFRDFAKSLGVPKEQLADTSPDKVSTYLKDILKKRQESLRKYACEISIDNCFDKKGEFKDFITINGEQKSARTYLAELIKDPANNEYFDKLVKGGEQELHFRTREHKRFSWLHMSLFSDGLTKSQEKNLRRKVFDQIKDIHVIEKPNETHRSEAQQVATTVRPELIDLSISENPATRRASSIAESFRSRSQSAEDPRSFSPVAQDPAPPLPQGKRESISRASFVERALERMSSMERKSFAPMKIASKKEGKVEVTDRIRMR